MNNVGPSNLQPGNYDPKTLSQEQRQWLYNYYGNSGNAPVGYGGQNSQGELSNYHVGETAPEAAQQNAQDLYQQQSQQAIQGLQTQKSSLAQQYSDLLKTVTGVYDPLVKQTTATAGAALSQRGLTPDSQLFQQQVQGALAPVYGQEAANQQQIGAGSISDQNTLAQAIASLQSGNAQFGAQLPLSYGSLALQQQLLPSQIFGNLAQGSYYGNLNASNQAVARLNSQFQNVPAGNSLVNTLNNLAINPSMLTQKGGGIASLQTLIP